MLSTDDNEILTRVGPGTPMGEVLRRYWTPALLSCEVPDPGGPPVRVRLLCEDLVAFRDPGGAVGLLQENCPHRGASLFFGRNEEGGLRCPYHGWQFGTDGSCTEMPSEPATSSFAQRVRARSYPVHESGGIVWAYLGPPATMTPFRDFGTEALPSDRVHARKQLAACNWIQSMEGNLDTTHISWLHQFDGVDDIPDDGSDKPGYPSNAMSWTFWRRDRAPRLEVEDTWYGYRYAGLRRTPQGYTHARVTDFVAPYTAIVASIPFTSRQALCVPIDDHNTWRYGLVTQVDANPRGHGGAPLFAVAPYETRLSQTTSGVTPRRHTAANDYLIDREVQRTATFSGIADFNAQDLMVTESMGRIYDRTQEHLGTSDRAVIRMRRLLVGAARRLRDEGVAPPALAEPGRDFRAIRAAEKILEPGEDWRTLGTGADPAVREALEDGAW